MATVRLGEGAIEYVAAALRDVSGVAALLTGKSLSSPVTFGPEESSARYENFDAGGVTTQLQADRELAAYLRDLKRKDFSPCSILFQDSWFEIEDLQSLEPPPPAFFALKNRVYYLYDIRNANIHALGEARALCISFLKLAYVSTMSAGAIREKVCDADGDGLSIYADSIKHVLVSAYDDETWISCGLS